MREVWRAASPPRTFLFSARPGLRPGLAEKRDVWGDNVSPSPSWRKVSHALGSKVSELLCLVYVKYVARSRVKGQVGEMHAFAAGRSAVGASGAISIAGQAV